MKAHTLRYALARETDDVSFDDSALAQLVEQMTVNHWVAGSSPAGGATFLLLGVCKALGFDEPAGQGQFAGRGDTHTPPIPDARTHRIRRPEIESLGPSFRHAARGTCVSLGQYDATFRQCL